MHEGVREQVHGRCWIRRRGSGDPHLFTLTWKHTGRRPGHRSPVRLAGVCVSCVRVPGGIASRNRGGCKQPPSYVCIKEYPGPVGPGYAVWIGLTCLPVTAGRRLDGASPRSSWGSCGLGQSLSKLSSGNRFAPLSSLDGKKGRSEAPGASSLS